jgi:YHS domain-containing protein
MIFRSVLIAGAMFSSTFAWSGGPLNLNKEGVGIEGYDPVAYFVDNKPVKGDARFSAKVGGATYHFASAANRAKFLENPVAYQPQYGGYCAFGVAKGFKPEVDPHAFEVVDGKLYLNKNADIQNRWKADKPMMIKSADEKWKELANK